MNPATTASLLLFLDWVAKNAPSFVNDMRLLVNGWCNETGQDPVLLLRTIELDEHKRVDSDIDKKIEQVYAQVEKATEQGSTEDGGP